MFSKRRHYQSLPQHSEDHSSRYSGSSESVESTGGETATPSYRTGDNASQRATRAWLSVGCGLTFLNFVLVVYVLFGTRSVPSQDTVHDIRHLEYRSPYIELEGLYSNTPEDRLPTFPPIENAPFYLALISSREPRLVTLPGDHYYPKPEEGFIPKGEQRITVNGEISTISHFRIMDWGMENCRVVLKPPAKNGTNTYISKSHDSVD